MIKMHHRISETIGKFLVIKHMKRYSGDTKREKKKVKFYNRKRNNQIYEKIWQKSL